MNCWEILGIESTADATAIRRSYARLIKENRPDENPEAFAAINRAYKEALAWAQHQSVHQAEQSKPEHIEEASSSAHHDGHEAIAQPTQDVRSSAAAQHELISGTPLHYIQEPLEDLNAAWERLTERTLQLLNTPEEAKAVDSWRFLEASDALYDVHFKTHFSRFLFRELISAAPEEAFNHPLKGAVIDYLDSLFGWRLHRDDMEYEFEFADIDFILGRRPSLVKQQVKSSEWYSKRNHIPEREQTTLGDRLVAALIDVVLVLGIVYLVPALPSTIESIAIYFTPDHAYAIKRNGGPIHFATAAVVIYFMMSTLMESSALQATPGRWLFKMKTVDMNGARLTIKHAALRAATWLFLSGTLIIFLLIYTSHGERGYSAIWCRHW